MRINQFIANATGLSRRAADTAVAAGRATINGSPAQVGQAIGPADLVELDGHPLKPEEHYVYIMLNKPAGYISSHARQGQAPTLYELLPPQHRRLRLVGRLDRASSGLVILSNDGQFIQNYSHPSHNKDKIYQIRLTKPFSPADTRHLKRGVMLEDGPSHVLVRQTAGRDVTVSISEGRNRQLRRTFGALGYGIERLHRISIGPFQLGNLPEGQWREFTPVVQAAA